MGRARERLKGINMQYFESAFQQSVVRFLRGLGYFVFAVPNARKTANVRQGALLKREGLLAGVSDLIIVLKNRVVFVELKTLTGKGRQSESQKVFQKEVEKRNHTYLLWDNWAVVEQFANENREDR